ncbi:polysaccharide deacetylase WbmS family protein [Magnetococcus sp. PR-3]|uniref:polysaccharide deacetylase WbmS family protein n=1 Tax=Magnetococcus sp. PR-3 TaxID=3120355 RepID=UPI002FCE5EFD
MLGITFDIDWAPDWAIEQCMEICVTHGVPATFFATHQSPLLDELKANPLFEVGIHPNFLPGSCHGDNHEQVLDYCMALVPQARSMRTHGLYQSSRLFELVMTQYAHIHTDLSLYLGDHPNLQPVTLHAEGGAQLIRLPYCWEDDLQAIDPAGGWDLPKTLEPGLRIYNFHPVHVALNMNDMAQYARMKKGLGGTPLTAATPKHFAPYTSSEPGTLTFLQQLMKQAETARFDTVGGLTKQWEQSRE